MAINDILRVTLAQVDLEWENPALNRNHLEEQIRQLTGKSDLIILPETFTTGFSMRAKDFAEPMNGPTIKWMLNLTHITGIAICGSLIIEDNGLYYNRFIFVTGDGEISFYNKRHLFSIGDESIFITPGGSRRIINYLGWRISPYVCYDLRFPVWCRNSGDTDLMIFSANWPAPRNEVWKILLKARAIENQVYVAGVNRIGSDGNKINYIGESQLINAKGEVLSEMIIDKPGWITSEISKKDLDNFRQKFPVSNDADRFIML